MKRNFAILTILFCSLLVVAHSNYSDYFQKKSKHKKGIITTITEVEDTCEGKKYYYGIASFYSKNLEGTETSTQETFRHSKLTCASNRFKLHTWLRVTNISNGKSIIVRVNDRMHPKMDAKGRIVDLSYTGAKKLDFVAKGITKVKVEIVPKGTDE